MQEIERLIEGYKKFREQYFSGKDSSFQNLAIHGQSPKILVIACSDSRVDPAIVMNCNPGDLFVVRNVANLIPPYEKDTGFHGTSAALEFAIMGLGIKHVIVFGHSKCGGIQHLMEDQKETRSGFIGKWMELARPAKTSVEKNCSHLPFAEKVDVCAQSSVVNSLKNLLTFPWVKDKIDSQELSLHGWFFDIEKGLIKFLNPETGSFEEINVR